MNVEIKFQEYYEKQGNDCYIQSHYIVLHCLSKYIFFKLKKCIGSWVDNNISCEEAREFDTEQQAIDYAKELIKAEI